MEIVASHGYEIDATTTLAHGQGLHIDPVTLEIAVRGHDLKVERNAQGEVRRQKVAIQDLEYWEDPDEVRDTVDALRMLIDEARVWLLRNPTKTARRGWQDGYELRLFLHSRGAPWPNSSAYSSSFVGVIHSASRLVNERRRLRMGSSALSVQQGGTGMVDGGYMGICNLLSPNDVPDLTLPRPAA
ncbi:MAG: hypothetical protein M3418_11325, partial [Gemmatimonadota bacterium]|nr:hypothetical protein [Gemmatimonadota bacterium]